MKIHKRIFKRNDGRDLLLYGHKPHTEKNTVELEVTPASTPHLRWNPSRQEWVTYSAGRTKRTSFPPEEYCPLCPGGNLNFPTEIPFHDFEIAVFPNRWSSFNSHSQEVHIGDLQTKPSSGHCEVVVYSAGHLDTVAEMPLERLSLIHI